MGGPSQGIAVFSTCPQSSDVRGEAYAARVAEIARWSERHGCTGMLVYTDNRLVDPWLVAQIVVQSTERLCPLVAVQPVYKHPYSVAKTVSSFAFLHGRRVFLNLVAGGFRNDLEALGDATGHDQRYDRMIEYGQIIQDLLRGETVTREGEYHRVSGLRLSPPQPPGLMPGVFVSGSSLRGLAAAEALGATAILYPGPAGEERGAWQHRCSAGIRVGIIARETNEEAWRVARARFPEDRKGEITHQLAMKTSDSSWHARLSEMGLKGAGDLGPYWLTPFRTYRSFCPYLVGSHATVAAEVSRYLALGYRTLLLDIPADEEELTHTGIVLRAAQRAS